MRRGLRTMDFVVHSKTQGGYAGRAWRIRLADMAGYCRGTKRRNFRSVAQTKANRSEATTVGSLLQCVHALQIELPGRPRRQDLHWCAFNQDGWGPSRGSAQCNFFARQGVMIPFSTHTHTLQQTNHPRCQSRLWVLHKSDTIEARVHSRLKTSSRWKNGVEVVQLRRFEESQNWYAH